MTPDHQDPLAALSFFLPVNETSKISTRAPEISLIPVNDAGSIALRNKASLQITEFAAKAIKASTVKITVLVYCLREIFLVNLILAMNLQNTKIINQLLMKRN